MTEVTPNHKLSPREPGPFEAPWQFRLQVEQKYDALGNKVEGRYGIWYDSCYIGSIYRVDNNWQYGPSREHQCRDFDLAITFFLRLFFGAGGGNAAQTRQNEEVANGSGR